MAAYVPRYPTLLVPDGSDISDARNTIRNGAPIASSTWYDMGAAANWLLGHGRQLVSGACLPSSGEGTSSPYVFRHYMLGTEHLNDPVGRFWMLTIQSTVAYKPFVISFQVSSDSYAGITGPAFATFEKANTYLFQEPVSGTLPSPPVIGFDVSWSGDSLYVLSTSCVEIPLTLLQSGDGVDLDTLLRGQPLYSDVSSITSQYFVRQLSTSPLMTRRNVFSWYDDGGESSTATTFTGTSNVFLIDPAIQAGHTTDGTTTKTVDWAANVQGTGGGGEIRLTSAAGSNTQSFSTTKTWVTGTLSVETDDPSRYGTDGGIRGGTRDSIVVEIRRTTASSVAIYGLCIGDA